MFFIFTTTKNATYPVHIEYHVILGTSRLHAT